MNDKNGTKVTRGTRVMVRFEDTGMEHMPLEWTGVVKGNGIAGRIKIQSEYVNWKPALHLLPADFTRLADQTAPVQYREMRPNGRVHVQPLNWSEAEFKLSRAAREYAGGPAFVNYK